MKSCLFFILLLSASLTQAQTQQPHLVFPVGHLGGITKIDVSPNEKLLLTEDLNSDIVIIDSYELIELQRNNFDSRKINSSAFLNDSSVISICNDTLIAIWNFYFDIVVLYPISVQLTRLYVEKHGLYCIDNHGVVLSFEISEKDIILKEFIKDKANELYFKSEKEIFLVDGKNLIFSDLNGTKKLNRKFSNEITSLSWNTKGNVLLGLETGEIIECDSSLNFIHNYNSISDRISVIGYINDSTIISGSYDFSVVTQNKKEILNSILFDDWSVGVVMKNSEIITCTWNGMINRINENLKIKNDFETSLKKATFFCQRENNLFISYNDGGVCHFDLNTSQLVNSHYLSSVPIIGIDVDFSSSELIIWNSIGVSVFDLSEQKIKSDFVRSNIVSAKFIPNTSNYIFCSSDYLYYFNNNQVLDSITTVDSWSITETKENSIIASGLNRIIEINDSGISVKDVKDIGQIWTTKKNKGNYFLGTSDGHLFSFTKDGEIRKLLNVPMGIDGIEIIDENKILCNSENGQLIEIDIKSKKTKIIADTKQKYGSWDFKVNIKSGQIIYPNSKIWNYKMDIDVLDLNGKLINKLENIGAEVICISQPNKSIEFNQLDSNQVIFIASDGSIRLWDINTDGNDPITRLGFDYYNLLKDELGVFNIKGAFLNSGLLKLPIPGEDTLTFMNLKNGEWLVHDSKYRFDGTPGAIEKLYFTCGLEVINLAQVKDALYVPDLVQRIMQGQEINYPKLSELQICDAFPVIEQGKGDRGEIFYEITPRILGLKEVEVYVNSKRIAVIPKEALEQVANKYVLRLNESDLEQHFLSGYTNKVVVIGVVEDGGAQLRSRGVIQDFQSDKDPTPPNIYGVFVGVKNYKDPALNLGFPAKDAQDLRKTFSLSAKKFLGEANVETYLLHNDFEMGGMDGAPQRESIRKTLEDIGKKAKPQDVVLLFFAGHGEMQGNEEKYFTLLTEESGKNNFTGISTKDLISWLSYDGPHKMLANKTIFILDACNSGQATKELMAMARNDDESQRIRQVEDLKDKSGMFIFAASAANQSAYEMPQYQQGLMTYSLLHTLKNDASVLDAGGLLNLQKWFLQSERYLKEMVERHGLQQQAQPFGTANIDIAKVDDEVRNSIMLVGEKATVVLENVLNTAIGLDDLDLKSQLAKQLSSISQRGSSSFNFVQQNTTDAYKINIAYTTKKGKLDATLRLVKDKVVVYERTYKNMLVEALIEAIVKDVKLNAVKE